MDERAKRIVMAVADLRDAVESINRRNGAMRIEVDAMTFADIRSLLHSDWYLMAPEHPLMVYGVEFFPKER